jgi:hypothetical protein
VGGIALGLREFDFDEGVFPNEPAPLAGTLIGRLTFNTGASLTSNSTNDAAFGADGRILVGVEGRGYLTMTGGSLTGQAIVVAGENVTTGNGTSLVDLSGSSTLSIVGGSTGIADFGRRLRITGSSVNVSSTGRLRLLSTNTYTAAITSATAHSTLTTGSSAVVGGSLFVEFSGAASTRDPIATLGQTWNLVDAAINVTGAFGNLSAGGDVQVSGLAPGSEPPPGAVYRLRTEPSGGRTLLQLIYDRVLVLAVNRDTGTMSITNPHGGSIAIESYQVRSPVAGSLLASYTGISDANPPIAGAGDWAKPLDGTGQPLNTQNTLSEFLEADFDPPSNPPPFNLASVPSVPLGTGFSKTAVADDVTRFGIDGEDLIFEYTTPTGGTIRGHVEYIGTKFENDLVLRVNPDTGAAFLKNDSEETLTFDGYSVLSSTGALSGTGFSGLGGTWQTTTPTSSDALTQTNLAGSTTLAPTAEMSIGNITNSAALSAAAQAGLGVQFILAESLMPQDAPGDYNNNGVVDAADYTMWRDNLDANLSLANENPNATTPGVVDQEDYLFWVQQFGTVAGPSAETTFRTGSVVFDPPAVPGGGSLAGTSAVPEPGTGLLCLVGVAASLAVSRRRRVCGSIRRESAPATVTPGAIGKRGVGTMSRQFGFCLSAVIAVGVLVVTALPAEAVTQGIPLVNQDFNLPGGSKLRPFDVNGTPLAPGTPITTVGNGDRIGGIPGWTFSGPGTEVRFNAIDELTTMPYIRGDSSIEGGGGFGVGAETHLTLSTLDGTAFQTSGVNVANLPATQKYRLSFQAFDAFTIDDVDPPGQIGDRAQLTAWLYFVNTGGTRVPIGTKSDFLMLPGTNTYSIEFVGGSADLTPALGRPLGVEFDTTSIEFNMGMPEFPVAHSWIAIDNLLLQITGTMAGDVNGDGMVDETDYGIVRDKQQTASFYEADGDLNGDGIVNLNDFRAIKNLINAQPGGAAMLNSIAAGVPEPATWVLVLLVAAMAIGLRPRTRRDAIGGRQIVVLAAVGLGALLASASPSQAVLLAYDPFRIGGSPAAGEYTLGPLDPTVNAGSDGQNPTIGAPPFFSGGWVWQSGLPGSFVQEGSLSYLGSPSIGGSVGVPLTMDGASSEGRVGRYLATPWESTTVGTFYIGYQANYGTVADPNTNNQPDLGFRTTEFWPVGNVIGQDANRSEIGYQGFADNEQQRLPRFARLRWVTPGGGTQFLTDTVFNEFFGTHLIVMKFVLSDQANMDSISVFLDPVTSEEPEEPTASVSGINYTLTAMSTISTFGTPTGIRPVFDELRVATTYLEAIPELPLPGDTNGDGFVDMLDYEAIITHLNCLGCSTLEGDVAGVNGKQGIDGRVDVRDLHLWRRNRTDIPSEEGAAALAGGGVPEPSSIGLLLVATLGLAGCIRRTRRFAEN